MRTSTRGYLNGVGLAQLLTTAAFGLVWNQLLPAPVVLVVVLALGLVQMLVHLRWFLHLRVRGPGWQVPALAFTLLIVVIMAAGTLWVLKDLNQRMM